MRSDSSSNRNHPTPPRKGSAAGASAISPQGAGRSSHLRAAWCREGDSLTGPYPRPLTRSGNLPRTSVRSSANPPMSSAEDFVRRAEQRERRGAGARRRSASVADSTMIAKSAAVAGQRSALGDGARDRVRARRVAVVSHMAGEVPPAAAGGHGLGRRTFFAASHHGPEPVTSLNQDRWDGTEFGRRSFAGGAAHLPGRCGPDTVAARMPSSGVKGPQPAGPGKASRAVHGEARTDRRADGLATLQNPDRPDLSRGPLGPARRLLSTPPQRARFALIPALRLRHGHGVGSSSSSTAGDGTGGRARAATARGRRACPVLSRGMR